MKIEVEMYSVLCAHCGMPFAFSKDKESRLRKCHNTFYCPDGHGQSFSAQTDEEYLRNRVRMLESTLDEQAKEMEQLKKKKPSRKVAKK
jgi:hypothetical protein